MLDYYLVETDKSFAEAVFDLTPIVQRAGFTVLNSYDFGETLFRKGVDFDEECAVIEIVSERYLAQLMALDVRMAMYLPWRITVFTQDSVTKIGMCHPSGRTFPEAPAKLLRLLEEIGAKLILIVDELR